MSLVRRVLPWVAGTLVLVLSAAALYAYTGAAASEPSRAPQASSGDLSYGPEDAAVTLIEYSDFQCPFCAEYAAIVKTLRQKYGDEVRFVYRFFPLAEHEYATVAAKAAYAAHLQGRFWEMQDVLYERQKEWSESANPRPFFDQYALELGLELERFHADMEAPTTLEYIARQAQEGDRAGVEHTPWFVLNDEVVLPRTLEDFEKLIEEAR